MHQHILNLFAFFKNCVQFIKILIAFLIVLLILYWIQNLLGEHWDWMNFALPTLKVFVGAGESISQNSIKIFDAVFEYKYLHALITLVLFYVADHGLYIGVCKLQEVYEDGRILVKKAEEKALNLSLKNDFENKQRQLKRYGIFISADIKPKFKNNRLININLEEELQKMNKFLIEQTLSSPKKFEDGFLYMFESFNNIDDNLEVFMKVIKSESPLNYVICVQVIGKNEQQDLENLKTLIHLKIVNEITALSETVLRYSYNKRCRYNTTQTGMFQNCGTTFEVHKFTD